MAKEQIIKGWVEPLVPMRIDVAPSVADQIPRRHPILLTGPDAAIYAVPRLRRHLKNGWVRIYLKDHAFA